MMDVREALNETTCYAKPVIINGKVAYMVHSSEGFPVTVFPTLEIAFAYARYHDLEPKSLH